MPTRPDSQNPPEPSLERIALGLSRLSVILKQKALRHSTLSPTQQQVLTLVSAHQPGSLTLKEVATNLGLKMPSISQSVSTLVQKGLISKERSAQDARSFALRLTTRGSRQAKRVADWPEALLSAINGLTAQERGLMLRMLTKMIRQLQEQGDIPPQRMCVDCSYFRPYAYKDPTRPHHCNFVSSPFGDRELQLDCSDQLLASDADRSRHWELFVHGKPMEAAQ